ncbi:MAG: WD40/YVTN/BNR-like repeat-containing protein [Candidatus Zixiibacteriota bacterium]
MRRFLPTFIAILLGLSLVLIMGCNTEEGPDDYETDNSTWEQVGGEQVPPLRDACFVNTEELYIVGDNGFIAHSTNRGDSWENIESPATGTNVRLYIAHFKEGGIGFVAGRRGFLLSTTDYGATWNNQTDTTLAEMIYKQSFFLTDDYGYILGSAGQLFKTEDCGQNWEFLGNVSEVDIANDIYFLDETIGFAGGSREKKWKTTDAGNSWFELYDTLTVNDTTSRSVLAVAFFDEDTGIVAGGDYTHKWTGDGGETWTSWGLDGTREVEILSINITGESEAYLATSNGNIWKTEDKGQSWEEYPSSITGPIYEIDFVDGSVGWQVGTDLSIGLGALKITSDGGTTWEYRSFGTGTDLNDVEFLDVNTGWACGNSGYIYYTSDGGATWNHLENTVSNEHLTAIDFVDNTYGWSVGMLGLILKTTDGGNHWMASDSGDYDAALSFRDVCFIDQNVGYICGTDATILKSEDGGASWYSIDSPLPVTWNEMYFLDENTGYFVGSNGAFAKTQDGGETWTTHETGTIKSLLNLDVIGQNSIWVCGEHIIMHSTDAGETWESFELFLSNNNLMGHYYDIAFFDNQKGWAVGNFGYRAHTVDGGETWYRQNSPVTENNLYGLSKVGNQTAYAVGNNGIVLKLIK